MPYLLDTHILLWWLGDYPKLSKTARELLKDQQNSFFVSSASAWEIAIKKALGKLEAPDELEKVLFENNFLPLSITISHALTAGKLPLHHLDPFDRMLISQAKVENLTIITHDPIFKKYPMKVIVV
jgi:PIN domain nuclease of toxin-antitoxin system